MAEDLEQLEDWIGALIAKLEPGQRRQLARAIGMDVRKAQVSRIAAQMNPDGSSYTPRKRPPLRAKAGRVKRHAGDMFRKLRSSAYLGVQATQDEVAIGFFNPAVSRLARVHQEGLVDKVERKPGAPSVRYAMRQLLGYTDGDRERVADLVMKHLQP
ncbi:MAG: phage virion morphogenesis protein [Caulobacteraceae bacterium]|nr:phage virion morphogenesis protein [Caulobacteraceae bacterium]